MNSNEFGEFQDWSDAENCIERAHDLYEAGRMHEALGNLQIAIEINPANGNWHFNKGLILDTLERFDEAVDAFTSAHELEPEDPEIMNCLGVDYTRLGQYERSLEIFEELVAAVPDFEPGYCNRIITYSEMGRHEKAEEMFYLARQLKDHCPLCYFNIGNSLFSRQLYDRAIWCWQQTRNLSPNQPQVECRIAQAYWAKGDYHKAGEHFLAELRRGPGDVEVLMDYGIMLLEMNDLQTAREKFNRIIELHPANGMAHHYLGELYLNEGRVSLAVESFNRAIRLSPEPHGSHYRLGECFLLLGQKANAREHLLAELKNAPEQAEVMLDLGCLLVEVDEIAEAVSCFERAIEIEPQDPSGYQNLSLCYYRLGLIERGIDLSDQVLENDPENISALLSLAQAHFVSGNLMAARENIQLARQLLPKNKAVNALSRKIQTARIKNKITKPLRNLTARKPKTASSSK